ncbi:unnamed protein product [Camellia sinensis]
MATAMARSAVRTALRGGPRTPASKRTFASSAHDDAKETAKWEKITYAGIVTCTVLAIYDLSRGHPHYDEPPFLALDAAIPISARSQQRVPLGVLMAFLSISIIIIDP